VIAERRKFDDLRGFVEYINAYKTDSTAAFASRERIQVVFDYHAKDAPRWGSHSIEFSYKRSSRWVLWEKNNNAWKGQEDFADFLDSGLEEIKEPSQSTVLDIVKNFSGNRKCRSRKPDSGGRNAFLLPSNGEVGSEEDRRDDSRVHRGCRVPVRWTSRSEWNDRR